MGIQYIRRNDPLQVIVKVTGSSCNINCIYCYEKRREYDESNFLSPEILEEFLLKMENRPLSIQLHGGEPLLVGREKMKIYLDIIKRYKGKVEVNLQTNGTLLDREWIDFLYKEWPSIEIGISIDGDEITNYFRVDYSNKATYDRVKDVLRLLDSYKKSIGIIAVVNSKGIKREKEILEFFSNYKCIKAINFTPCFDYNINNNDTCESKINEIPTWAISPKQYTQFIMNIFTIWISNKYYNNFTIEPIFSIVRSIHDKSTRLCHYNYKKCTHMMTLYPNGNIGSCDELYMTDSCYFNIKDINNFDNLGNNQLDHKLFKKVDSLLKKCEDCDYYNVCKGGCCASRMNYYYSSLEYEYCRERAKLIDFILSEIGKDEIDGTLPFDKIIV